MDFPSPSASFSIWADSHTCLLYTSVPYTLGDDGTTALRIEPNYLYEIKATFPQGEAEYAFYTVS